MADSRINAMRERIEVKLAECLPAPTNALAPSLVEAMRYATLAGGKRLRPLLCLGAAEAVGGDSDNALVPGCAIELIHTYSLIHDDLPAMDDDQLRRGKPTCHVRFSEAEAILAGDALQALAFELIAEQALPARISLAMTQRLARAVGWSGMVGGQSFDLALTDASINNKTVTQTQLEALHAAKTGALLQTSIELGALTAQPSNPATLRICEEIGALLGTAFQVIDDVLDVSQSTETLGKDAGSDAAQGKTTFVDLLGESAARRYALSLFDEAKNKLDTLPGNTELLDAAAREVVFRNH